MTGCTRVYLSDIAGSDRDKVMKVIHAFLIALLAPFSAFAVPVTYSYTGELISFASTLPDVPKDLSEMQSTRISGWAIVDLDADGTPLFPVHPQIFGYGHSVSEPHVSLSGEGFQFRPNDGTAQTYHGVSHTVDPSGDSVRYGELFDRSVDTPAGSRLAEIRTLSVDFLGPDLLGINPRSLPDPAEFATGAGRFAWWTWDEHDIKTVLLEGVFLVDSIQLETTAVPAPPTWSLFLLGLVFLTLATRRRLPQIHRSLRAHN